MPTTEHRPLGRGLTFAMAAAAGIAVANIYYNQPMLGIIERDFPASVAPTLIPTATQLGYAAGLILLVPLGDILDRRRLIAIQFAALTAALVLAATAPNALLLVVASLLVGASATVAQQIVPFAASLADPQKRGSVIGTVMAGLLCGILLSRTVAGIVAAAAGWRAVFWLGVPLALAGAAAMAIGLPGNTARTPIGYGSALVSLAHLWREEPALRRATIVQAGLFACFSVFWTILALYLQSPAYHLGAGVAGTFGVIGVVGIIAAPLAGKLADRMAPRTIVVVGIAVVLLAWLVFGLWASLSGLVVGVILLDFGLQSAMISHQHIIYTLRPEARGRINTVFMTGMFLGGALGSAGAMAVWNWAGWSAVSAFGAALTVAALVIRLADRGKTAPHTCTSSL